MYTQRTFSQRKEDAQAKWFVVDADGQTVGRLASKIATILRGKHRPEFTPSTDCGDFVVVTNAEKVRFTGNKLEQKKYYRHSGYVGGLKETTAQQKLKKDPEFILKNAIKGMLPKNVMGRHQLGKLKVYAGAEHPHEAQQPQTLEL